MYITSSVSVLFNEPKLLKYSTPPSRRYRSLCFSALQRAEIAEIIRACVGTIKRSNGFSALQRAEIAEIDGDERGRVTLPPFQCSSTSRNC